MRVYFLIILIVYRYLKTFIIMAKFELKFKDRYIDRDFIKVEMYKNNDTGESSICFEGNDSNDMRDFLIMLDKSTAIKLAKTLRTEINKIKEE